MKNQKILEIYENGEVILKKESSFLRTGKPIADILKYQWQILDFQGSEKDFKFLWNKFLEEYSCHSCICKLNLSVLENFEFKKINNFYSYYPFSVVYRIDDLTDGKFYVGMCEIEEKWNNGYIGSGRRWKNHYNVHLNHKYKRTILKENFKTPLDTRNFELQEIKKVFEDENNCNAEIRTQDQNYNCKICSECGGKGGKHKKSCSRYRPKICSECGGKSGHHKDYCSKYSICPECGSKSSRHKEFCSKAKKIKVCSECQGKNGNHKKSCSQYKEPKFSNKICSECGGKGGKHKKACSMYKERKPSNPCPECGKLYGHKKFCSQYKEPVRCSECGKLYGHKKCCSKYNPPKPCPECGGLFGHKDFCSKSLGKCKHCGYSLKSNRHAKDCPFNKNL